MHFSTDKWGYEYQFDPLFSLTFVGCTVALLAIMISKFHISSATQQLSTPKKTLNFVHCSWLFTTRWHMGPRPVPNALFNPYGNYFRFHCLRHVCYLWRNKPRLWQPTGTVGERDFVDDQWSLLPSGCRGFQSVSISMGRRTCVGLRAEIERTKSFLSFGYLLSCTHPIKSINRIFKFTFGVII